MIVAYPFVNAWNDSTNPHPTKQECPENSILIPLQRWADGYQENEDTNEANASEIEVSPLGVAHECIIDRREEGGCNHG